MRLFFSLLIGSLRKNGRLGDPALPSLSSNSLHVKHFHPKFPRSPSRGCKQRPSNMPDQIGWAAIRLL
jgi:hypothetical protein